MTETFWRDLEVGQGVERKHLAIIQKTYPNARQIEGYHPDWDIWIPEIGMGIEIKSDQKSQYTNNIVVEIAFNGKPSALSVTKATYWIFFTGKKSISVRVDDLKALVKRYPFRLKTFTAKGDTKPKEAYLMPQHHIESIGQVMDITKPYIFDFHRR